MNYLWNMFHKTYRYVEFCQKPIRGGKNVGLAPSLNHTLQVKVPEKPKEAKKGKNWYLIYTIGGTCESSMKI